MSTMSFIASVACIVILMGCREVRANAEEVTSSNQRQPRHLSSKLCLLGLCGGQGHGGYQGYQGGHGGYQGYQGGHGGYQGGYQGGHGGYQGGYPPINIGISQSQSSSSAGGGGYGSVYFPNNYQFNGNPGGHNGYPGGHNRPGYLGNGFGSYNNQFNGNYYGGRPQGGGYGFQGSFGNNYDEDNVKPVYENEEEDYYRSAKSKN